MTKYLVNTFHVKVRGAALLMIAATLFKLWCVAYLVLRQEKVNSGPEYHTPTAHDQVGKGVLIAECDIARIRGSDANARKRRAEYEPEPHEELRRTTRTLRTFAHVAEGSDGG